MSCKFPGGYQQVPWGVLGETCQVHGPNHRGVLGGIALGSAGGSLAECVRTLGQMLAAFLGDCLGESRGKPCKSPEGFRKCLWGDLVKIGEVPEDFGQFLDAVVGDCFGDLWGEVLQNVWGMLPKPWEHPWASPLGKPWKTLPNCLGCIDKFLGELLVPRYWGHSWATALGSPGGDLA